MKVIAIVFAVLFVAGLFTYAELKKEQDDSLAVKAYVESKGLAPVPPSWRGKVGKGI